MTGSAVGGPEQKFALSKAKAFCLELGDDCRGLTCTHSDQFCTVRSGPDLKASPGIEDTYVKSCEGARASSSLPCSAAQPRLGEVMGTRPIPVVVLAHNREADLRKCLGSLLAQADASLFDFHVSLDDVAAAPKMKRLVEQMAAAHKISIQVFVTEPLLIQEQQKILNQDQIKWVRDYNTAKIAHHYWTVFERTFVEHGHESAIFVEEDLVFAPDFLALFRSTTWLLQADSSLWCVSAWNDVGFSTAVSDQCRLQRTTWFPGLGFMLTKLAWSHIREMWPPTPTMGWDYFMRAVFRQLDKECIIPEVSRSHHVAEHGSSINSKKQVSFFQSMALATVPNSCGKSTICRQFGDTSYLLKDSYERHMQEAVSGAALLQQSQLFAAVQVRLVKQGEECSEQVDDLGVFSTPELCAGRVLTRQDCVSKVFQWSQTTEWGCRCCNTAANGEPKPHQQWNLYQAVKGSSKSSSRLDEGHLYIIPYIREDFRHLSKSLGLQPPSAGTILPDVRSDHYGMLPARDPMSRAQILLLDRRSPRAYLPTSERIIRDPGMKVVPAVIDQSCTQACGAQRLRCDKAQLHFVNDCAELQQHFDCKWCLHQVGQELPVLVTDRTDMNYGQCLMTAISSLSCDHHHPHTQRLCACTV